ncbi:hypothetical protein [Sporomusa sphaeroides]|uniref:hypothetical protein n=1 Tax=Sporomusa sphaeroides TaxID=47679 RepID=UPI003D7C1D78
MVIHNGKILEDNLSNRYFNMHHLLKQLIMRSVFPTLVGEPVTITKSKLVKE